MTAITIPRSSKSIPMFFPDSYNFQEMHVLTILRSFNLVYPETKCLARTVLLLGLVSFEWRKNGDAMINQYYFRCKKFPKIAHCPSADNNNSYNKNRKVLVCKPPIIVIPDPWFFCQPIHHITELSCK